jgi:hypothetical protein
MCEMVKLKRKMRRCKRGITKAQEQVTKLTLAQNVEGKSACGMYGSGINMWLVEIAIQIWTPM